MSESSSPAILPPRASDGSPLFGATPGRPVWEGLFAPLNVAAYAVLLLVAFNQLSAGAAARHGAGFPTAACALSLAVFLAAFVLREVFECRSRSPNLSRLMLAVQALAAVANLALVYDGMNPILLVLIAAQLPAFVPVPAAVGLLVLLNAIAYLLLREVHEQARPLFNIAVYGTFQAFALLTAHFAFRVDGANRDLQAVNAHLLATRSLLEDGARDGERLRLSRELHDVAGHALTALKLNLELARRVPDDAQRRERIDEALQLADALLEDIRGVVSQLRSHDGIDLPQALSALARGFPGVDVRVDAEAGWRITDVERAESILRAVQEALTNAVRHGGARSIRVRLSSEAGHTVVEVSDDGRGPARQPPVFGNGLTGIRERMARFDATVDTGRAAKGGFVLTLRLPDEAGART